MRNFGNLPTSDLSNELYRMYDFGDEKTIRIDSPLALNVSRSGGHRILDAEGVSHYVPEGWIHLKWESKEGAPAFDF